MAAAKPAGDFLWSSCSICKFFGKAITPPIEKKNSQISLLNPFPLSIADSRTCTSSEVTTKYLHL